MTYPSAGASPEYEHFKNTLIHELENLLPQDITVDVRKYPKDNGYQPEGISFRQIGPVSSDKLICSPIFYINDLYSANGQTLSEIRFLAQQLADYYRQSMSFAPQFFQTELRLFEHFESARAFIAYRLVNTEANRGKLAELPHREFLDLSMIFLLMPPCTDGPQYTCTVTNAIMQSWQVDIETICAAAYENTPRLLPYRLQSLPEALKCLCNSEEISPEDDLLTSRSDLPDPDDDTPIYVLSNRYSRHGASAILYPELLHSFADRIGSDLYILPSSIHEVLVIDPARSAPVSELRSMVCSVNAEVVSAEEILSDQVYYYSRAEDKLSIAPIDDADRCS